jgi:pyrroline-5-carboxylate reductase
MAKLLESEHSAVLREKFSRPKGTTIDGLLSLEEDRARYALVRQSLRVRNGVWRLSNRGRSAFSGHRILNFF